MMIPLCKAHPKHPVDMQTWDRKGNFAFFSTFLNPQVSITTEIECTEVRNWAKEQGYSFFLCCFYAVLRAANEIRELRYRLDEQQQVVIYDRLDGIAPIKRNGDQFVTVRLPYCKNFTRFHAEGRVIVTQADYPDPYYIENKMEEEDDKGVILLSVTPDLYFTSITYPQRAAGSYDFPLLNAGKVIEKEGLLYMPLAISAHHGLVDGAHLSRFFTLTQHYLHAITQEQ